MNPKPSACTGCPAAEFGLGFVPPTIPSVVKWVVVGQGPGEQEAIFSQPFYPQAPTGKMMRGWLADAGIPEDQTSFGNVVQCWLPKHRINGELGRESRPATKGELDHCWKAHVRPWLAAMPENAPIIAVGAPATRQLLGLAAEDPAERLAGVTHRVELPL